MRKTEQTKAFQKKYKKLKEHDRAALNKAIKSLVKTPGKGDRKKGNLRGYSTWSFKLHGGQCRLLYHYNETTITLVEFGPRENFYG